jgi:hypothetical protein
MYKVRIKRGSEVQDAISKEALKQKRPHGAWSRGCPTRSALCEFGNGAPRSEVGFARNLL